MLEDLANSPSLLTRHGAGRPWAALTRALLLWLTLVTLAQAATTTTETLGVASLATPTPVATTTLSTASLAAATTSTTATQVAPTPVATPVTVGPTTLLRLDENTSACQGLRVAALGPERVAVGWTVPEGAGAGIFLRQRLNNQWSPVRKVTGATGAQPRDLDLAFDAQGRLHLAWTARDGVARRVFYGRLDVADAAPQTAVMILPAREAAPTTPTAERPAALTATDRPGEADFPALAPDGMGAVLVWQESQALRYTVRAARVAADGSQTDLGEVSGASTSGMAPQILATSPTLCVAWYEITDAGSELRVSEWSAADQRWQPSSVEREGRLFPHDVQVLLNRTDTGLVACWQDCLADGRSAIKVGLVLPPVEQQSPALATETVAEPAGEHSQPHLAGNLPGRLTLTWQVFSQGQQSIHIASLFGAKPEAESLTLSPPEQRFAAQPDHVTVGRWSAVVWTDDVHNGGQGGVYFAEVNWPSGS